MRIVVDVLEEEEPARTSAIEVTMVWAGSTDWRAGSFASVNWRSTAIVVQAAAARPASSRQQAAVFSSSEATHPLPT